MSAPFAPPKAFVSYAWENREHKQWVKELAMKLRVDGVELLLDQWELAPGDQLAHFMEKSVRSSDSVLIVCTPAYKAKSDDRVGGVGYEGSVITAELVAGTTRRKFIPLLRRGEWKDSAPSWLLGSVYLDFRGNGAALEDPYAELLDTLHGRREGPPPVGSPPFPERHRQELPSREGRQPAEGSWAHVWKSLMEARPQDPELFEAGQRWLLQTDLDNPGWAYVWKSLRDARPHDPELFEIGQRWLLQTDLDDPEWTHVWKVLMDARPHDPDLFEIGQRWLQTR